MNINKRKIHLKEILNLFEKMESSNEEECISVGQNATEATLMGTRDSFINLCHVLIKNIYDSFDKENIEKEEKIFFFDEIKKVISDYGNFWPTGIIIFDSLRDYIESIRYDSPLYFLYLRATHSDLLNKLNIDSSLEDLIDFDPVYKEIFFSEIKKT